MLNITGCQFLSNSVTTEEEDSWGGGVVASGGEVSISDTVFWNNSGEDGYIYIIYFIIHLYTRSCCSATVGGMTWSHELLCCHSCPTDLDFLPAIQVLLSGDRSVDGLDVAVCPEKSKTNGIYAMIYRSDWNPW